MHDNVKRLSQEELCLNLTHHGRYKRVMRVVRSALVLSAEENQVLMFVLTVTVGANMFERRITDDEFRRGINRKNGLLCPPPALAPAALRKAIEALVRRRIVRRHVTGRDKYYEINLDWEAPGLAPMWRDSERDYKYPD
jgi:hypothetical protein